MTENELSKIVIDTCLKIHKELGPGLFESVYEAILAFELGKCGLKIERQIPIPVIWKGMIVENAFKADIVVENKLLLELKSTEKISNVYKKQVLTYLKISGLKLGLLINFGQELLRNGITRVVNGLKD